MNVHSRVFLVMNIEISHLHVIYKSYFFQKQSSVRSEYSIPNYAIAIIVCCIVAKMTALFTFVSTRKRRKKDIMEGNDDDIAKDRAVKLSKLARQLGASTAVLGDMDSGSQLMMKLRSLNFLGKVHHLAKLQWKTYRPGCINIWRVVEVSLLGALVGILFYNVGNNPSAIGLSQKTSLLFFSVTLWTFTRMYPSVGNTHAWFHQTVDTALYSHDRNSKVVYATAAWVSRTMISFSCEGKREGYKLTHSLHIHDKPKYLNLLRETLCHDTFFLFGLYIRPSHSFSLSLVTCFLSI